MSNEVHDSQEIGIQGSSNAGDALQSFAGGARAFGKSTGGLHSKDDADVLRRTPRLGLARLVEMFGLKQARSHSSHPHEARHAAPRVSARPLLMVSSLDTPVNPNTNCATVSFHLGSITSLFCYIPRCSLHFQLSGKTCYDRVPLSSIWLPAIAN
jgi:hypothetical protein